MRTEAENVRRLLLLLSDEEFVEAVSNADRLVDDADETLLRVREIERSVDQMMYEVDERMLAIDTMMNSIVARLEASVSVVLFILGVNRYLQDDVVWAAIFVAVALTFSTSLVMTLFRKSRLQRVVEGAGRMVS